MSDLKIMLPTDLPLYKSKDRTSSEAVDHFDDDTPNDSDKQLGFGSDDLEDEEGTSVISIKKRHRRGKPKKRKWKPYYKLSWQERRELDDLETERANLTREARFAHGQPVAPYNTTQFLMEDHNVKEPDFAHHHHIPNVQKKENSSSIAKEKPLTETGDGGNKCSADEVTEEFYSSPDDEEDFLQKQFSEAYENVHAERLNAMSKADLVQEYIQLEERVETLESDLKECQAKLMTTDALLLTRKKGGTHHQDKMDTCLTLDDTLKRLLEENEQLRCENELLRTMTIHGAP